MGFKGEFNVDLMVIEWDLTKKHVDNNGDFTGVSWAFNFHNTCSCYAKSDPRILPAMLPMTESIEGVLLGGSLHAFCGQSFLHLLSDVAYLPGDPLFFSDSHRYVICINMYLLGMHFKSIEKMSMLGAPEQKYPRFPDDWGMILQVINPYHDWGWLLSIHFWWFWGMVDLWLYHRISGNRLVNESHTHRIHGAGIYANVGGILMVNVTIYSIHGSYGI